MTRQPCQVDVNSRERLGGRSFPNSSVFHFIFRSTWNGYVGEYEDIMQQVGASTNGVRELKLVAKIYYIDARGKYKSTLAYIIHFIDRTEVTKQH